MVPIAGAIASYMLPRIETKRIRISQRPVDPGRISVMFLILDVVTLPASGRFKLGPRQGVAVLINPTIAPPWLGLKTLWFSVSPTRARSSSGPSALAAPDR